MKGSTFFGIAALVLVAVIANASLYIVQQYERGVLLRFGKVENDDVAPGIHVKVPFMDVVRKFDGRILTLDNRPERFLTVEKKSMMVDSFAKWRIIDVGKYYRATNGEEIRADRLLSQRINEGLRNQFAQRSLQEVVSGERDQLMEELTTQLNDFMKESLGIEVIDVRVKRIDLPTEVSEQVFSRMAAEREREAREHRANGQAQAEIIRADADRQRTIIEANAYKEAELLRGEGDARAASIYSSAFQKDPEFYAFTRSLNAYKKTFNNKQDVMLVDPKSDFFQYLQNLGSSD